MCFLEEQENNEKKKPNKCLVFLSLTSLCPRKGLIGEDEY